MFNFLVKCFGIENLVIISTKQKRIKNAFHLNGKTDSNGVNHIEQSFPMEM